MQETMVRMKCTKGTVYESHQGPQTCKDLHMHFTLRIVCSSSDVNGSNNSMSTALEHATSVHLLKEASEKNAVTVTC